MSARIVIAAGGSLGDLHPFLALGLALQARGCQVGIASSLEYQARIEAAGLAFCEAGPSLAGLEADLGMSLAEITEAIIADDLFLFRRILIPWLEPSVRQMVALAADADVIVGGTLTIGAAMTAESILR